MVRRATFWMCTGFVLAVFGCAAIPAFTYKYYGLAAVSYDGSLLGPKPADDLTFKLCDGVGKCVVMLSAEFFKLKGDYLNLEAQLKACQGVRVIE